MNSKIELPMVFLPDRLIHNLQQQSGSAPIPGSVWYVAQNIDAGFAYRFPQGALSSASYLTADVLLDGEQLTVFSLYLQEGENGPEFHLNFGLLNQCSARMRIPLEAVNQNRWRYPREGAWLKPMCGGKRVNLAKVDRMRLVVARKSDEPARFCMTPLTAVAETPPLLDHLCLPKGKLIDEMGQSMLHNWEGKSKNTSEVTERLRTQLASADQKHLPEAMNRWGGWISKQFESTGFFRTHHDGIRWWLVDPDGCAFWSSGLDCVRFSIDTAYAGLGDALEWLPDPDGPYSSIYSRRREKIVDYFRANFIRAFGAETAHANWAKIALSHLREFGFNTVANWSDWDIAREKVPYTRPLVEHALNKIPKIYRDFPDVFHPEFAAAAAEYASQLQDTVGDPAFIGYFLMNEPTWGFAQETPAAGMLFTTPSCFSRSALAAFLRERHSTDAALSASWGIQATFDLIEEGVWQMPLTDNAQKDLADFSEVMVTRYFNLLSDACRKVDPNHLNLGIRYYTIPPDWAVQGMRSFDIFSMNCYKQRVLADQMAEINKRLNMPIMVGEWHFGALDVGLPASGIGHVPDQVSRGKAFRIYLEDAAAKSWCVGVHYFTLYDQSALGRFDGENYNIGFVDTCNKPYEPLAQAARASHERLYRIAAGELLPFDDLPVYLPLLFT